MNFIINWAIGFFWLHKRVIIVAALSIVLIIAAVLVFRSCRTPEPKLNQKEIIDAQIAVEQHRTEELKGILANSDVRVQAIDSNIKQAEEAREKAVRNYDGWTVDELAAELEKRK